MRDETPATDVYESGATFDNDDYFLSGSDLESLFVAEVVLYVLDLKLTVDFTLRDIQFIVATHRGDILKQSHILLFYSPFIRLCCLTYVWLGEARLSLVRPVQGVQETDQLSVSGADGGFGGQVQTLR